MTSPSECVPVMTPGAERLAGPARVVPVRRDRYGRLDWSSAVPVTPESAADWDVRGWRDDP